MSDLGDALRDADPFRREPAWTNASRDRVRHTVVSAASAPTRRNAVHLSAAALVGLGLVTTAGVGLLGPRKARAAAVLFEMRLAEDEPGPGLVGATVGGSDRVVYLHDAVIVSNGHIRSARVVEHDGGFGVAVVFTAEGAEQMDRATRAHLDRPIAIMLDGEVVSAPTIRSVIRETAVLEASYARADAERIAAGVLAR